jgi:hypothetical protein
MVSRIEIVDALEFAAAASTVLRAAWKAPCLDYSAAYCSWQLGFPGRPPKSAAIALIDDRPVGCIGITPRRFRYQGAYAAVFVLSFVAVDPSARGCRLSSSMYAELLDTLPCDTPIIAFAEPGSNGERLLLDAFEASVFRHRPLGPCRAFGYVKRRRKAPANATAVTTNSYADFLSVVSAAPDNATMWNCPTLEQWNHYQSDPRSRSAILILDGNDNPIGSSMVVMAEILTARGHERVPMIESICLPTQSEAALGAAFDFASDSGEAPATVIASNLSHLDAGMISGAGVRALPSAFNAHLFGTHNHALKNAANSNLEVI